MTTPAPCESTHARECCVGGRSEQCPVGVAALRGWESGTVPSSIACPLRQRYRPPPPLRLDTPVRPSELQLLFNPKLHSNSRRAWRHAWHGVGVPWRFESALLFCGVQNRRSRKQKLRVHGPGARHDRPRPGFAALHSLSLMLIKHEYTTRCTSCLACLQPRSQPAMVYECVFQQCLSASRGCRPDGRGWSRRRVARGVTASGADPGAAYAQPRQMLACIASHAPSAPVSRPWSRPKCCAQHRRGRHTSAPPPQSAHDADSRTADTRGTAGDHKSASHYTAPARLSLGRAPAAGGGPRSYRSEGGRGSAAAMRCRQTLRPRHSGSRMRYATSVPALAALGMSDYNDRSWRSERVGRCHVLADASSGVLGRSNCHVSLGVL